MALRRKGSASKTRLLSRVPLFSACNSRELARIASLTEQLDVESGKVLTREGDPGREFFIVIDGRAKATARGRKAASLPPGSFFGELALLDQGPRSATVVAETAMQLLVLDSRGFSALVEDTPTVGRKIMRALAERLRAAEKKAISH